jgi:serine/threonine-protein kinase
MATVVQNVSEKKHARIGDYIITSKIGQGGIAEIFKGYQESLGRDVAIKMLSPQLTSNPEIVRRFERESMVIARLNHPNIVHVIDRGSAGGRYYFVMEYIDGTSMREVIDSRSIATNVKLEMIAQVCKALDYAHKNGVIHRDIKPANILIDRQGNARVADFGIAQIIGVSDTEVTGSDIVMGTLAYMSPEQKVSSTNIDQTTDLYAIGVIIYEILLGRKPLGHFKLPSEIDGSISQRFDEIVQKCLAPEAKDRFQSANELKNALMDVLGGGQGAKTPEDLTAQGSESFIGKCRYLDTIKENSHSSTVLVENRVNKKLYVIKRFDKPDVGRKEAKLFTSLKHKHILNIIGSGGDTKSTVIISEYASGGSLAERMVRKYEWEKAMQIVLQVAAGLDFAHKNNVVHGNLRPSNVLFADGDDIKICDFGLTPHYTDSGKKNWYAPPEHKRSKLGDIYALGVILHQLITGRTPQFDAADKLQLDDVRRYLPQAVVSMLEKLLGQRVINRYQSCEEIMADWNTYLTEKDRKPVMVAAPVIEKSPWERIPAWGWAAIGAGAVATVFLTLVLTGLL